jgi:hypothetical protein
MKDASPKTGWLSLAFLAGMAGSMLFTFFKKSRSGYNRRFLTDFPAYAGDDFRLLKSRP